MLQPDKIITLTNATSVGLESVWATLLAKARKNVKDLFLNVESGGGGGVAAAAEAPREEENKENESDDHMVRANLADCRAPDTEGFAGFGLFD